MSARRRNGARRRDRAREERARRERALAAYAAVAARSPRHLRRLQFDTHTGRPAR